MWHGGAGSGSMVEAASPVLRFAEVVHGNLQFLLRRRAGIPDVRGTEGGVDGWAGYFGEEQVRGMSHLG